MTKQLLASDLLQFEMLKIPALQAFWKTALSKSVIILSKANFNFRFCWMKYSCIYWYCHNSVSRDFVKHLNLWKFGNQNFGNLENLEHQTPEYPQRSNSLTHLHRYTVRKVSKDGVFSGPYFPLFRPNAEKIRTGKNSVFGHFSRSDTNTAR